MTKYKVSMLVDLPDDMHMEDVINNIHGSTTGKVLSVVPVGSSRKSHLVASMPIKIHLEQYECIQCGRFFYVGKGDRSNTDIGFGCPYGCDDNGKPTRIITAEIMSVKDCKKKHGKITGEKKPYKSGCSATGRYNAETTSHV